MRRTERAAYRTKFYSNLSSPTRFDEEPMFLVIVYTKKVDNCQKQLSTFE